MKNILKFTIVAAILSIAVSCDSDEPFERANYVNFQPKNESVEVVDQQTAVVDVKVYSTTVTGNNRVFDVNVSETTTLDSRAFSVPETVVIPGGSNEGTLSVDITDANENGNLITLTAQKIDFSLSGGDGSILNGDLFSINVIEQCLFNSVTLTIAFDDYPEETYWAIYDAADTSTPLLTGGAGGAYAGESSLSTKFCLEDGDYLFAMFDAYGDGIVGDGYTLTSGGETLASGADFGSQDVTAFSL